MSCFIHPDHCSFCSVTTLCLHCFGAVEAAVYAIDLAVIRRTSNKDIISGKQECSNTSARKVCVFYSSADSSLILELDSKLALWISL